MRTVLLIPLLCALIFLNSVPVAGQTASEDFYREWVDYSNGQVTLTFYQIPLSFALDAIHAKTGLQIIMPSNSEIKLVNLKLDRQPFEPAMRSFISTMGYKNFALMYDQDGRPHRAVVLGARPVVEANAAPTKVEPQLEPLTAEEREKLQTDLKRWSELKQEERGRIEDRIKNLPPTDEREELVKEFGRQVLALKN